MKIIVVKIEYILVQGHGITGIISNDYYKY